MPKGYLPSRLETNPLRRPGLLGHVEPGMLVKGFSPRNHGSNRGAGDGIAIIPVSKPTR